MLIYGTVFFIILLNGLIFGKKRKWFVFSSFLLIIVVAALRSTNVGIDLAAHYASNFEYLATSSWSRVILFSDYDIGFKVLLRLLGYFSTDPQILIVFTSVLSYGSVAVFVYKHSDDPVTDLIFYFAGFTIFQYMNLIAQVLAVALILFGIDWLFEKKYFRFVILVAIAATLHASAILCLILIPINFLKYKRSHIVGYIAVLIVAFLGYSRIMPIIVNNLLPVFSFYLTGNIHGTANSVSKYELYNVVFYLICILSGFVLLSSKKFNDTRQETILTEKYSIRMSHGKLIRSHTIHETPYINTNFLLYMAITVLFFYVASFQVEVSRRCMYYFIPFAFILPGRLLKSLSGTNRLIIKVAIYVFLIFNFFYFGQAIGEVNTGVIPYELFWK